MRWTKTCHQIRLCFAARHANTFLGERARGLARYLPSDIRVAYQYEDTSGVAGWLRCFVRLIAESRRQDVLWLISQHPARVLAAWIARIFFGTRFIVDTADLLSESARIAGKPVFLCQFLHWWELLTWRLPDAVVVHGTYHKMLLESLCDWRVVFIPDGVECAEFVRCVDPDLRRQLGIENCVTLGILATIGWVPDQGIPSPGWDLVECLTRLSDLPLKGVVIGDGPGLKGLHLLVDERGITDKVTFVGRVPYADLSRYISTMDICLHTALNNRMSQVRTTGKLPVMLACGCAMVASAVGEAARVLDGTGMLLSFNGSREEYAVALTERVRALVEQDAWIRLREIGPAIAKREFDNQILAARATSLIRDVVFSTT